MTGIVKRFGGVRALQGARLVVRGEGEVHALVGANGSGKSTILGILCGLVRPDDGQILWHGQPVTISNPHAALQRGIVMVSQEIAVVPQLSVAENVLLGRGQVRGRFGISRTATRRRAAEVLKRLGVEMDLDRRVGSLRPDQQQLVEIARALSADTRLLILDEPTSSLTEDQVVHLMSVIGSLKRHGVSVLFVSHRFSDLYEACDRVTVLRAGTTVLEAPLADCGEPELIAAMTGGVVEEAPQRRQLSAVDRDKPPALEVSGMSEGRTLIDVDLAVHAGEVVGVAGLVGSGRSELLEAVFGVRAVAQGTVTVGGSEVRCAPRAMIDAGVGYLPADRKTQGLVLGRSILENLVMVDSLRWPRLRMPRVAQELTVVRAFAERMRLRHGSARAPVRTLSGGNQQKVALGKWLAIEPRVLILDEPTRGVDVPAKAEIHALIRAAAGRGVAVLVSSSEMDELAQLCDRVVVMSRGRITSQIEASEISVDAISSAAGGHG